MWSGPIGIRLYSGSRTWPPCPSTSMIGTAVVTAPGPSFRKPSQLVVLTPSSSLISSSSTSPLERLGDAVPPDQAEVHVHQQHDKGGQDEHVNREEALQRVAAQCGASLQDRLSQRPQQRSGGGDLDRDRGRP